MFKTWEDHGAEAQTETNEPVRLLEDDLDAVVGGGDRVAMLSGYLKVKKLDSGS